MPQLKASTLTRVSVGELGGVTVSGDPSAASASCLSGASGASWSPESGLLAGGACPDLVTLSWESSGATLSADVDLVATHYCELDDVRAYRETAYGLSEASDADVFAARAMAEDVIERECHRFFVPVLREAIVERTNCSAARYPVVMGGWSHDIRRVVSAEYVGGGDAPVTPGLTGETVDVSRVRQGAPVRAVLELGAPAIPAEIRDATISLAAWYLLPKAGPDNAISESTEAGVMRYVVGGVAGAATSLPAVNAAIERHGAREWNLR